MLLNVVSMYYKIADFIDLSTEHFVCMER